MADDPQRMSRRPHPVLVAFATIGIVTLLAVTGLFIAAVTVLRSVPKFVEGDSAASDYSYLSHLPFEKAIAGIKLEGEITSQTADIILKKLREAQKDDRIVGILFDVNSPGGSVVPSQEIYDAINAIKEKKPVITYVHDMAASGAYYASASSSKITANRGSLIGSIGVILASVEATQLINWMKLKPVTLKTGKLKDAGSPIREWTDEDKRYLQTLIDDTAKQFVADVVAARSITADVVHLMSDGRVVLGPEAVRHKLIDSLGTKEQTVEEIARMAGLKETPKLIYLEETKNFKVFLSDFMSEVSQIRKSMSLSEKLGLSGLLKFSQL